MPLFNSAQQPPQNVPMNNIAPQVSNMVAPNLGMTGQQMGSFIGQQQQTQQFDVRGMINEFMQTEYGQKLQQHLVDQLPHIYGNSTPHTPPTLPQGGQPLQGQTMPSPQQDPSMGMGQPNPGQGNASDVNSPPVNTTGIRG